MQRVRWASKTRGYKDFFTLLVALTVFLVNLSFSALFILGLFQKIYFFLFGAMLLLKILLDFPLVLGITTFVQRRKLMAWFIFFEFIYGFYVTITGVVSFFFGGKWKGRKVRR